MLLKANQLADKKMSNVEVKAGTTQFSNLFSSTATKNMRLTMPSIPEIGPANVAAPTTENLNQLQKSKTVKKQGGPRTTAFSTMSGFSQMSNSSFMQMLNNPFGNFGLIGSAAFAQPLNAQDKPLQTEETKEPEQMNTSQGQGSTNAEKPIQMMPSLSQLFRGPHAYSTFNMPQTTFDLGASLPQE